MSGPSNTAKDISNGVKIAITGKGGVGKTTVASLLANAWVQAGYKVLAIDADPVSSLAGALGFPEPEKITPLSEMSGLIEERTGAKPGTLGQMFKLNPTVDDLPDKIAHEHNGIRLVVMGGVKTGGGGCVCPESTLIKTLIRHIILERDERVIIDMEAGVEHLGRSTADAVNLMITVVEPGLRSIQAAHRIKELAGQIGINNIAAIGNKIRSPEDRQFIIKYLDPAHKSCQNQLSEKSTAPNFMCGVDAIKLIGTIPFSESISGLDRKETVKPTSQIEQEIKSIMDTLEQHR